jgi:RHS repeat-associated protein
LTCPDTGHAVTYGYDSTAGGNRGVGRRTSMTNSGASVSWVYDPRGRVTSEVRSIYGSGGGTFVTASAYDAADRVTSVTYPDGEVVSYTYTAQGPVDTVSGTATYVGATQYNALGQVELRKLGSPAGVLSTDYIYRTDNFRLQWLKTGTVSPFEGLQKLEYAYDAAGNVDWLKDWKAGAPQLQDFTYDSQDRLIGAVATGGSTGTYNETYVYAPNGNLTSKTGVGSYTYNAPASGCSAGTPGTKPHAVQQAGSNTYSYDCNGNLTGRTVAGVNSALVYDTENRLTGVSGGSVASFAYDADGGRVKATFGSGDSASITAYAGSRYEQTTRYQETFDDGLAQGWTASSGTWAVTSSRYQQSATTSNTNSYRAVAQSGPLFYRWVVNYTSGTSAGLYLMASAGTGTERGNGYRIWQDATTVKIYENAANVATLRASFAAANAAGQSHSYSVFYDPATGRLQVARDGVTLGSWIDTTPLTTGAYLSLRTDGSNVQFDDIAVSDVVKYYEAGGTRVAVRKGGAVSYLFGDHLGSTSVTTSASGVRTGELWYKPWGESRGTPYGTTPTTYRYTGQREDASLGLYFYGARYYDSALGRFVQPDTLVPSPSDPQSLNRYSYVGNNPLNLVDPTGHMQQCPDCGGSATPVVILDPNRVNPDEQRRILLAWYDAHPGYNPATDPVLNGQSQAQPLDLATTQALLTMEYGLWQMDNGDRSGLDTVGAGLLAAVVILGPGVDSGILGGNQEPTTYRGGAYGKMQTKGLEAHHIPADSTTGIPTKLGPAIQMERSNHRSTSSWGPGTAADAFRAKIKALVDEGSMRDAMAIEIWDVRRVAGSKYNSAIQEMLDYAKSAGFITK